MWEEGKKPHGVEEERGVRPGGGDKGDERVALNRHRDGSIDNRNRGDASESQEPEIGVERVVLLLFEATTVKRNRED